MTVIAEMTWPDWIGVLGSIIIAIAYFAATRGAVDATRPVFNLANLTGAGLILFSLYFRPNPGAIVIEILWALIAISALVGFSRRR